MTSERESGLALMNIYYGRQIDIGATIDILAPKHPPLLYYPFLILSRSISSESEIYNPLLEILATFGAEIIGNLSSESRKRNF